jgi:hypothetical protein
VRDDQLRAAPARRTRFEQRGHGDRRAVRAPTLVLLPYHLLDALGLDLADDHKHRVLRCVRGVQPLLRPAGGVKSTPRARSDVRYL